jgi:hypothetical protein
VQEKNAVNANCCVTNNVRLEQRRVGHECSTGDHDTNYINSRYKTDGYECILKDTYMNMLWI